MALWIKDISHGVGTEARLMDNWRVRVQICRRGTRGDHVAWDMWNLLRRFEKQFDLLDDFYKFRAEFRPNPQRRSKLQGRI